MSEVKVNKISPRSGTTVTLGDSGDTFTIPAGATITNSGTAAGFGATGAASWDTTVKTTGFTAVSGVGYFVNTTGGAISVNLPAGTAGDVVAIKDYANTFDTNKVTLVQNGSDKIGGSTVNATLETEGLAVTLVFVDATQGWLVTDNGTQDTASTAQYIVATGGTITCSGDFRIHTFTGPGTFTVCSVGNACGSNELSYMVVAGGGGGGGYARGGGGGAGGFREGKSPQTPYTASPLATTALTATVASFPITVGSGGAAGANNGTPAQIGTAGGVSTFSTITSAGGGGGGSQLQPGGAASQGLAGGSGGGTGGAGCSQPALPGGAGNTPPVSPAQGFPGGTGGPGSGYAGGGGGGGALVAGATAAAPLGGVGGNGTSTCITGSSVARSGGGGGGQYTTNPLPQVAGGTGGGGYGGGYNGSYQDSAAGTVNTGGGGGGSSNYPTTNGGSAGGSGIVVIRYKFQN